MTGKKIAGAGSPVDKAPDSLSKDCEFKSWREQENFLLQT